MNSRQLPAAFAVIAVILIGALQVHRMTAMAVGPPGDRERTVRVGSYRCGVELWDIKTGTDAAASKVNLSSAPWTSIGRLNAIPAPASLPDRRIYPTEYEVRSLTNVTLVEFKQEADSDIHLVLRGTSGYTMIAEIPDLGCVGSNSPFLPGIKRARSAFAARYTATGSWQVSGQKISLSGVVFFDFKHGQTGVASNAIELHPVLQFRAL